MTRPDRIHVEGGYYHVYNRLGRGEQVFGLEQEAEEFVRLLRDVAERDGLSIFAWALMSNHYHLAVRTGVVSLDRPMRSLQQRVTRGVNRRRRVWGSLWQGRYKAKLVESSKYLDQLLVYIHLNPVAAGIVDDPADYKWSGHLDLLGKTREPTIDVDQVLRVFGRSRRAARAAYVRRLKGAVEEEWIGEVPGCLPWWRLGRPPKGEEVDLETAERERRKKEELGPEWRAEINPGDFVSRGAACLGVEIADLRASSRGGDTVRARELLMVLGVERYRLKVKELASELQKSPDGMSQAIARGVRRRVEDARFRKDLNELDRRIARADETIAV